MNDLHFRRIDHGSDEYRETVALRYRILREPLGLHFTPAQLEAEEDSFHLACYEGHELLACLVLVPGESGRIQMRQVAVAAGRQGQGIGRRLVRFAEAVAREHGFLEMFLHARETAVPFYEKLGYHRVGEPFVEVTLPHWEMMREL